MPASIRRSGENRPVFVNRAVFVRLVIEPEDETGVIKALVGSNGAAADVAVEIALLQILLQ